MRYFQYLPSFEYSTFAATNIMVRAKVREYVLSNAAIYYSHRIEEGERPDTLASKYYGNASFTWLLFYANDIYDPIFDWPLDHDSLVAYMANKVGSLEIAQQTPHHYLLDETYVIDRATYEDKNLPASRKRTVSVYEYELEQNEKKRNIKIIDETYSTQITNEMRRLFL